MQNKKLTALMDVAISEWQKIAKERAEEVQWYRRPGGSDALASACLQAQWAAEKVVEQMQELKRLL